MSYTPLDSEILTSTLLKNGPDVVACWMLLLASCDKLGESSMQPSAVAGLMRISDERAEAAFAILQAPDPKSRNKEHDGKRILPLDGGRWFIVSHQKYQWLASKAKASQRQRKYEANKTAREEQAESRDHACEQPGCEQLAEAAHGGRMLCSKHVFDPR
jgi:hypothetical protein